MNWSSKISLDLQDSKRIHKAWKSRMHNFIQSLPTGKINRQERNETSTLDESLETLLSQKCGQIAFRDFLKSEFCEENLDFWLACQEFQTFDSPEELTQRAASIYEEFVSTESPKQVKTNSMRWPKNKLKPKYKLSIKRKLVSTCIFNVVFLQEWQLQFFGNS